MATTKRRRTASSSSQILATPIDDCRSEIPEVSLRLRDALSCKVCKDWLDDPIVLNCGFARRPRARAGRPTPDARPAARAPRRTAARAGHALCRDCATQWFAQPQRPTCPTCRREVSKRAAVTKAHSVQSDLIAAVAAGRAACEVAGSPAPKKAPAR